MAPGSARCFEVPAEAHYVGPAHLEQPKVVVVAPGGELAQIEGVGVAGETAVAGQEAGQREALGIAECRVGGNEWQWMCQWSSWRTSRSGRDPRAAATGPRR
ncbi:MAG: hypothetical protein QOK20_2115 [Acidimicrobiaceae bacterium]|nr:hypothetical protein [Acidimicrobiaceae bacterium]